MSKTCRFLVFGVIFCITPFFIFATENAISETVLQLQRADDLRLSDFKSFQRELLRLEQSSDHFNHDETDYFTLLKASEYALLSEFDKSTTLLESRLQDSQNGIFRMRALALLVNSYVLEQQYSKAFEYFDQLLNDNGKVTDERALVQRLGVIALLYIKLNKHELAEHYLQDLDILPISAVNRCRLYTQKIEAMSAALSSDFSESAELGFNLCVSHGENIAAGFIITEIIKYHMAIGEFDKAVSRYEQYKDALYKTGYAFLIAKMNAFVSQAYFNQNNVNQAELLAKEALAFSAKKATGIPFIEASKSLYVITKSQDRYKEALTYLEMLNDANRIYQDDLTEQLLAFNLARGEIEVKNQRIALLDKDNEVLFLQRNIFEQEVKQNRLIMMVLVSVLGIASVLAYRGVTGHRRFKKIAEYDQLTGVANRYHFTNQAQVAVNYCEKKAEQVSVILFDLDYFKHINDQHGHAMGDWALQAVVQTCRNFMRNNDVFGRIGGEEFVVVLPGCQIDKALLLAEICRDAIANIDSTDSGAEFLLTASFGVAGSVTSGYVLKQLLADADKAMYIAKAAGRNQVAQWPA